MATILILEDDAVSAAVLEEMLAKLGHQSCVATRCADAWTRLCEADVDILILDTDLNGETGWEFLDRIRKDVLFAALPVIVCSGISRREVVQRYLALGIQGMLIKPAAAPRLAGELAKAARASWPDAVIEPASAVMERENLTPDSMAQSYRRAADEIWATMGQVAVLQQDPFNAPAVSHLIALKGCADAVNSSALERLVKNVLRAYNRLDAGPVQDALKALPVFVRLLRRLADALSPQQQASAPLSEAEDATPAAESAEASGEGSEGMQGEPPTAEAAG